LKATLMAGGEAWYIGQEYTTSRLW